MSCGSIICYQKESKIVFPLNELCASTLAGANWPLHNFFLTKKHHHPQGQGSGGVPRLHWGPITQSCTLCDSSDYFLWLTVVLSVEHWQKSLILHIFTKNYIFIFKRNVNVVPMSTLQFFVVKWLKINKEIFFEFFF